MGKNIGKNISVSLTVNIVKKFLIMLNSLQQMSLKLLQKKSKTVKETVDLIGNQFGD